MASNAADLEKFTSIDSGGRTPEGWQAQAIFWVALIWAFFQLYIASNVPFLVQEIIG